VIHGWHTHELCSHVYTGYRSHPESVNKQSNHSTLLCLLIQLHLHQNLQQKYIWNFTVMTNSMVLCLHTAMSWLTTYFWWIENFSQLHQWHDIYGNVQTCTEYNYLISISHGEFVIASSKTLDTFIPHHDNILRNATGCLLITPSVYTWPGWEWYREVLHVQTSVHRCLASAWTLWPQ